MNDTRQTILLADDSPTNLELVAAALEAEGCELVVATDGLEALERAERVRPDLILLDVMMPGLDGFEVCRRLKADPGLADVPVIFMTSLGAQSDKLEAFAAGGVDYLTKPLQLDEVKARVRAQLKLRAMRHRLAMQNDELRTVAARLAEAQRIARLGSWELDLITNRLEWSDEVFRIFEIDRENFGASFEAFVAAIHPDDREAVQAAYAASLDKRTPYEIEHRLLFADGRVKHVQERGETTYGEDGAPLRSVGTVQDVTALKEAEIRLRQSRDLLRALAGRQETHQEAERREIARKLHEDLAQNLSALRLYAATFVGDTRHADAVAAMQQAIDRSVHLLREMVAALRPTVLDLGIAAALRWLARDFEQSIGLRFVLDLAEDAGLPDKIVTFLFRVAQELLVNVALHAAAKTVRLSFAVESNACRLAVRDDGRGFDPAAPRESSALGLARLAEQTARLGGEFVVEAARGHGACVEIGLPLPPRRD